MGKKASPATIPKTIGQAVALQQQGKSDAAEKLYQTVLEEQPSHFDALYFLGLLRLQQGRAEAALPSIGAAIKVNPHSGDAHFSLGVALARLNRHEEAVASFDNALGISPRRADALHNRANALQLLGRYREALASYDRALAIKPEHGNAIYGRGRVLQQLNRHVLALRSYDNALAVKPNDADILNSKGNVLQLLNRHARAVASYDKAIALRPDHCQALYNRGNALQALNRHEEAIESYERALAIAPNYRYALGAAAFSRAHVCDWTPLASLQGRLVNGVRSGESVSTPFPFLAISVDPGDQRACASTFVREKCPPSPTPLCTGARYQHDKIRLAYLSADFHDHATAYLIAQLFETHDRSRFEVFGVSFGPDTRSTMRARLTEGFDTFIDVRDKSDEEVARLLREAEVDIAIDLKGFTTDSRPEILAHRPSPIQVNYLGYPGTMGADYIDYIIADRTVIPEEEQCFYAEKVVYLPDTYQPNDSKREFASHRPTRSELGLPEHGFVFCSFNSSYKITASVFDVWMRLLRQVEGSVLWLLDTNTAARANLKREAANRGVVPARLVFAPRTQLSDHLSRHRLADVFLDTLPINAHTTCSDAMWAGLPVLTCLGTTFAGRVAASLLHAIGLPELVTHSIQEYEALALRLAREPLLLKEVRRKLARNRLTAPLFDADRFRRHIEAAYLEMWNLHQRDERPRSITILPRGA